MTSKHDIDPCKRMQDSFWFWIPRSWIPDSRCWISDALSVKLRFQIPVISGILDSLSFILDSKAKDSRIRIPLHGVNNKCQFLGS